MPSPAHDGSGSADAARTVRRGVVASVSGLFVLSLPLFTNAPLILLAGLTVGCLLVLAGCLAWFFASRSL